MKNKENNVDINLALLTDKKSERTTFKLTIDARLSLEWLQKHFKLTIKEIFDYITWEILKKQNDIADIIKITKENPSGSNQFDPRKTYVISRATVKTLNNLSKKYKISRDELISNCIEKIKIKIKLKNESDRKKYIEASKVLSEYESYTNDVCKRLIKILEHDDLVTDVDMLECTCYDVGIAPLQEKLNELIKEK